MQEWVCDHRSHWSSHTLYHPEAAGLIGHQNDLLKAHLKHQLGGNTSWGWGSSSRMPCASWIKDLYMVLCPQQEEYMDPGTKGWKQEGPTLPSLSVSSRGDWASRPHSSGLCRVRGLWLQTGNLPPKDTVRVPLKYLATDATWAFWAPCMQGPAGKKRRHHLGQEWSTWMLLSTLLPTCDDKWTSTTTLA